MTVRADEIFIAYALGSVLAVVAEARKHVSKRLDPAAKPCFAAVVLKADYRTAAGGVGASELIVADHTLPAADCVEIHRADKVAAYMVVGFVIAAHHLVAAADRQEGHAVLDRGFYFPVLAAVQIVKQHLLLKVLPAADKHYVAVGKS